MILVTDASGRIGSAVARQLAAAGHATRAILSSPGRAARFDATNIELTIGTLTNGRTLPRALEGVRTVVLVTHPAPELVAAQEEVIMQSRARGIERIVKLSAAGADTSLCCDTIRWHSHVEHLLLRSGIPSCVVRASRFMQTLEAQTSLILAAGMLTGCQGDGCVADVDVRDVAAVLATLAIRSGDHIVDESIADVTRMSGADDAMFEAFELTGPAALTRPEVATLLSAQLGRRVQYVDCAPGELLRCAQAAGFPAWQAEDMVAYETAARSGSFDIVTTAAQQLLGRPARTFAAFAHEFAVSVRYAQAPGMFESASPATMIS